MHPKKLQRSELTNVDSALKSELTNVDTALKSELTNVDSAPVAELVDALDLGSSVYDVQVRVLSGAHITFNNNKQWL